MFDQRSIQPSASLQRKMKGAALPAVSAVSSPLLPELAIG
jgi:hypothetical protein